MIIDHVGLILFPNITLFRIIGRISLPIYAFLIAEGCRHTRNRKRYFGLIFAIAIIYQLVFLLFMQSLYQGILVTFSLSIAIIFTSEILISKESSSKDCTLASLGLLASIIVGFICPIIFADYGFIIDYEAWGIVLPVIIYFSPSKKVKIILFAVLISAMACFSKGIQWWALLSIPLIALYNGERGNRKMKYLFYIAYPLHLVIIYGIAILIAMLKR